MVHPILFLRVSGGVFARRCGCGRCLPEQRVRLAELLAERGRTVAAGTSGTENSADDSAESSAENVFPLSLFQQGMWSLEQVRPGNPAHVQSRAVGISGPLHEVVRRHEALRTTFRLRDGRPEQAVAPPPRAALPGTGLPEIDLRGERLTDEELSERIVADPAQRLGRLELLDAAERERILADAGGEAKQWPAEEVWIHQCFERRMRERPYAEALRFEGQTLGYAQPTGGPISSPTADRAGRRPGRTGGRRHGAFARPGGGTAGGAEGRRCLRPARPRVSPGPA